jgi:hypothetical protein
MKRWGEAEDPRRRWLIQALAMGAFSGAGLEALGQVLGSAPSKLPAGKSVYRENGKVRIKGQNANTESKVGAGSTIQTGRNGEIVYAVGESAFILRADSQVVIETPPDSVFVSGIKLLTGKLLSVFPSRRPVQLTTRIASIGIRGTGVYMESDPEQTYFCTCYGVADVSATNDPESKETVAAKHHDKPLYILGNEPKGKNIRPAPFVNHTDQELMLIETLVGRQPPFVFPKSDYTGPRRGY